MRKPVIKFFTDQTIFWNPGDAFNTAEELRNPAIVKAFRRIGMSDQAGTGIRSIFRNWHDLGNVPPELHNDKTKKTFELILRKEILLTPEQKAFQQSIGISLSAQEASVLAYATEQDRVSLTDLRALTHCTHVQAKALATLLVQQTLLVELAESLFELAPLMKKRFSQAGLDKSKQKQEQLTEQVKRLLLCLEKAPLGTRDIMQALDLRHRPSFTYDYLQPGLAKGFCSTGMTGVAAQLCGDKNVVMELGYQIKPDGTILQEETDSDGDGKKNLIAVFQVRCTKGSVE